jgi:MIP family channel proteins
VSQRYDREEELRRRSRERGAPDQYTGDEGYGDREIRSGSQSGGSSGLANKVSDAASQVLNRGRQGSSSGEQVQGLYGSEIGGNVLGSALAELIGTFILVFTGCAVAVAAILQRPTAGPAFYDSLAVALAFGIGLVVIVAAIGHVSGAHVNPAVTLALAVTNKFPWAQVPVYIGAQLLGAVLGTVAVWISYGDAAREVAAVAATFPVDGVGDLRAFLVEIFVTFILVFVVISVATDDRAPAGVAPLAVGFALACGVLIAGPVTGGSLNPARTLGPMIVAGQFSALWVYIFAPVIGAVLAALLYDRFISEADATG